MKERPMLFSGPMVRAILAGRKTQTRRVIKVRGKWAAEDGDPTVVPERDETGKQIGWEVWKPAQVDYSGTVDCPYGATGDRLWVKETFRAEELVEDSLAGEAGTDGIRFAADGKFQAIENTESAAEKWCAAYANGKWKSHWRPAIFMPRWASRITLEIVSVRVDRLQDITGDDARAEGVHGHDNHVDSNAIGRYRELWESINGENSWAENPWVWVVEFKPICVSSVKICG